MASSTVTRSVIREKGREMNSAHDVAEKLLTDKYGRWEEVFGADTIQDICDRMEREFADEENEGYIQNLEQTITSIFDLLEIGEKIELHNGLITADALFLIAAKWDARQKPGRIRP